MYSISSSFFLHIYSLENQTFQEQLGVPIFNGEWSSGVMVLGKLPVPGRPTILMVVGQGPIALAVGAGGGCLDFLPSSIFSLTFLPLSGRRLDID